MAWTAKAQTVHSITEPVETYREIAFVSAQYVPTPPKVKFDNTSCVIFARQYTGNTDIKGIAYTIKPITDSPYVGGVVLLNEGRLGHVAVITGIVGDSLYLIEANYIHNQISTREISLSDSHIKGFR